MMSQSKFWGAMREPTTQMMPDEPMATQLPASWAYRRPVVATEMPPPWAAAWESQAISAQTKPVTAAMHAVLGPSWGERTTMEMGTTAEPMQMPMKLYTQPRPRPMASRMSEAQAMTSAHTHTTMREWRRIWAPVALLLMYWR